MQHQTPGVSLCEWEFFSNITKAASEGLDEWVDERETLAGRMRRKNAFDKLISLDRNFFICHEVLSPLCTSRAHRFLL
jgi:hypothetical protein